MNIFDRAVAAIAPRAALRRAAARHQLRAYEAAAVGRRTDNWMSFGTSADAEIWTSLPRMRNRSRDLSRNNPHANKALNVWANNLVGTGIRPVAKSKDEQLNAKVMALWDEFASTCDPEGLTTIYGLQDLWAREMVEGGDVMIRRRWRRAKDGLRVPVQLQTLEGDYLDATRTGEVIPGHPIVNGVEFNMIGQRLNYWLFKQHPGQTFAPFPMQIGSDAVPASEIAHLYRKERTMARGVPWCHAIVRDMRDLDDYRVAEIVRKKTEACIVAIVTGADAGDEPIAPVTSGSATAVDNLAVKDSQGRPIERFAPGMIAYSAGGKHIEFNNPQGDGRFTYYKQASLLDIAAGYLVPYELLTGDLSGVNFSSARVGLVEFRRLVEAIQWHCLIPMACQPIWNWFCEAANLAGEIPVDSVPVEWNPPAFESVNPLDDANAELIELRSGTLSLPQAIQRRGYDYDKVMADHAKNFALLDKLGLVFDSDPRRVARGGNEQPSQSQQSKEPPKPLRLLK